MKKRKFHLGLLLFLFLQQGLLSAQEGQGSIRGFIFEEKTGEAVLMANVYLKGTTVGQLSNEEGYFALTQIKAGDYLLVVKALGYELYELPVNVGKKGILSLTIKLKNRDLQIDVAVISGIYQERKTKVQLSQVKLSSKDVEQIPSLGGTADLAQYLEVLPGIVSSGDQGGQLYVRGGSPVQNLVLMDGIPIQNPFHSMGAFSVFENDMIQNVNVSTGGFPAKYGGRISSVMDVGLRAGNAQKLSGKIAVTSLLSSVLLEGPIPVFKNENPITFLLSGRYSYLDKAAGFLNPGLKNTELPFSFADYLTKLSFQSKQGSRVSITGFNFSDQVAYDNGLNFSWNNTGFGAKAVLVPTSSTGIIQTTVSYANYSIKHNKEGFYSKQSSINNLQARMEFVNYFRAHEFRMGAEVLGIYTDYYNPNSFGFSIDEKNYVTDLAGYFSPRFIWGDWIVESGLRLNYYSSVGQLMLEPRVGAKYQMNSTLRFKVGGGRYTQNMISGKSDRDVVNFFTGYLMDPQRVANESGPKLLNNKLQSSWQAIFGTEWDPNVYLSFSAEGFYKYYPQLISLNVHKKYDLTTMSSFFPEIYYIDFLIERGSAYGLEGTVQYQKKRFFAWMAYSLAKTQRFDGLQYYAPHYDRRHDLNLLSSYTLGKDLAFKLQGRWHYGSGFPFTPTGGFYEKLQLESLHGEDILWENGLLGISFGDYNSARLPDFHRLDLSLKYTYSFGASQSIEATLSCSNVYNRNNLFYYDRLTYDRKDQLPILISGGIIWRF